MFHHLLVATDGSDIAGAAVHEAILLAVQQRADLAVLHVIDFHAEIGVMQMADEALFERHMQRVRQAAWAFLDRAAAEAAAAGVPTRVLLQEAQTGRVADAIAAQACIGCDLLVIGTHGRHGWQRFVLGSEAEAVLRQATVPVLLVRGEDPGS